MMRRKISGTGYITQGYVIKTRVPLGDDPVSAYIRASKKTPDQREDELRTAAKIGTRAPGRMGKGWPAR